jgi:hypothetical protein
MRGSSKLLLYPGFPDARCLLFSCLKVLFSRGESSLEVLLPYPKLVMLISALNPGLIPMFARPVF